MLFGGGGARSEIDRRADACAVDGHGDAPDRRQCHGAARIKVPAFIEDPIIRQQPLAVAGHDSPLRQDRRGIREGILRSLMARDGHLL